jgi:phosphoribosyl 1,2-cyclic phosphodiesterase
VDSALLIDCGTTGKAIETELSRAGVNPFDIDAIIVTHEHIDHIKSVGVMCRRYRIPVYATVGTWKAMIDSVGKISPDLIRYIAAEVPFKINETQISPFSTSHDAAESIGLVFESGGKCGAITTDLGTVTRHIYEKLCPCSILMIEANHDEQMLKNGSYPQHLKERILSDCGHLSNKLCGALCAKLVREGSLRKIMLGHLSADNNTPHLAYETVRSSIDNAGAQVGSDITLFVADRYSMREEISD